MIEKELSYKICRRILEKGYYNGNLKPGISLILQILINDLYLKGYYIESRLVGADRECQLLELEV